MTDAGVRFVTTTPTAEDFASQFGPPVVLDILSGIAYMLKSDGTVVPIGGGGAAFGAQLANTLFAGPSSGGSAIPAFRAGVVADTAFTASPRLFGRSTAAAGKGEEILVGTGLTLTGGTLAASGGGGAVVQVVNFETGAVAAGLTTDIIPVDDTIPQNTEGKEYMSLAITPTDAANKLLIEVRGNWSRAGAGGNMTVALFQDTTANALAAVFFQTQAAGIPFPVVLTHFMTAGTTSETTLKVRCGHASGAVIVTFNGQNSTSRFYGGVYASSITITEIVP